jgi:hypothetical protein
MKGKTTWILSPYELVESTYKTYTFDYSLNSANPTDRNYIPQDKMYPICCENLVIDALEGFNGSLFAYGQTGSGKTFSMTGPTTTMQDGNQAGIIPRAIQSLFDQLIGFKKQRTSKESIYDVEVRIQFLELYGEEIRDLLTTKANPEKLAIRDIGMEEPEVLGATQHKVEGPEDAMLCLARGMLRRVQAQRSAL